MSTRTTGRVVGGLFLLAFVVYIAGGTLVDSATGTPPVLSDVVDHQTQLAAGALLMFVNSVAVLSIGVLVLPVLRARHEVTAYLYLAARVFEAALLTVGIVCLLLLLPIGQAWTDAGREGSVLPALAQVATEADQYAFQLAMIGLGLGGLLFCRALFRARLVPRFLAVWGLIGYAVFVAGLTLEVLGYDLGGAHMALGGLFEITLGVVLLIRGFPAGASPQEPDAAASTPYREALAVTAGSGRP